MYGIGLLILLAIYAGIIKLLVRFIRSRKCKAIIISIAVAVPLIYPYIHLVSPSYSDFVELCEADDRKKIRSTKNIDYLYLGQASMCYNGFKYLSNYKGIECEFKPKENGEIGSVRGIYRYIKGENWLDSSCGESCLTKRSLSLKEECQFSCMKAVTIEQFTNPYEFKIRTGAIIRNKIDIAIVEFFYRGERMAEYKNYTYYPYGNTWAKILGGSSGSAPSSRCKNRVSVNVTEFLRPK